MNRKKKVIIKPLDTTHPNDAVRPAGERPCPICAEVMASELEFGTHIDLCDEHGAWLDRGELDRLLQRVSRTGRSHRQDAIRKEHTAGVVRGLFLGTWALLEPGRPVPRSHPPRRRWAGAPDPSASSSNADLVPEGSRPCPVCDATMSPQSIEDVVVDVCEDHGLWLDEDELAEMLRAARARSQRSLTAAKFAARRQGAVHANIWGFFSLLS